MQEGHNAQVAALLADVADMPPHLLEQAIKDHVQESNFMPKAAQLIAKCQNLVHAKQSANRTDAEKWARRALEGNRLAIDKGHHPVMHWKVSPAGFGTEIVNEAMPRETYDEAMRDVDIAVFHSVMGRRA